MRLLYLSILLITCILGYILLCKFKLQTLLSKVFFFIAFIFCFFVIGSIINVNTLSPEVQEMVDFVVEECGDSYVTVKGSSVYLKVNDRWLDVENIEISNSFSKNYTITYDDEEIVLNSPGIRKTLKYMYEVGLAD